MSARHTGQARDPETGRWAPSLRGLGSKAAQYLDPWMDHEEPATNVWVRLLTGADPDETVSTPPVPGLSLLGLWVVGVVLFAGFVVVLFWAAGAL